MAAADMRPGVFCMAAGHLRFRAAGTLPAHGFRMMNSCGAHDPCAPPPRFAPAWPPAGFRVQKQKTGPASRTRFNGISVGIGAELASPRKKP